MHLTRKRKDNEARIKSLREEIATEQEELISKHKTEINNLLVGFNSNIRIIDINRDNKAGGAILDLNSKLLFWERNCLWKMKRKVNFYLLKL